MLPTSNRPKQKSFRQARKQIYERLAFNMAQDEIDSTHDLIEDEIAGGQSFAAIAKKFPVRFVKNKILTRNGSMPKGLPEIPDLSARIFATVPGDAPPAQRFLEGGYYWLAVQEIIAAEQPSFDKARAKAAKLWQKTERGKKLKRMAETITQRAAKGTPLAKLTKVKPRQTPPLARFANSDALSADHLEALFRLPKGGAFNAPTPNGDNIIVARLIAISEVKDDPRNRSDLKGRIRQEIAALSGNELFQQYIAAAQQELGISVYEQNLNLAFERARQR